MPLTAAFLALVSFSGLAAGGQAATTHRTTLDKLQPIRSAYTFGANVTRTFASSLPQPDRAGFARDVHFCYHCSIRGGVIQAISASTGSAGGQKSKRLWRRGREFDKRWNDQFGGVPGL